MPENYKNEWRARGAWVRATGKPAELEEPGNCHKTRKDLRAGFFLFGRFASGEGQGMDMREAENEPWWLGKRGELLQIAEQNLNAYVYDLASIERAVRNILSLESVSRVLYAVKANFNADVLRSLANAGADFDCVSPGEVERLRDVLPDRADGRILFTSTAPFTHGWPSGASLSPWIRTAVQRFSTRGKSLSRFCST